MARAQRGGMSEADVDAKQMVALRELVAACDLRPGDLPANRKGRLTSEQTRTVGRQLRHTRIMILIGTVLGLAVLGLAIGAVISLDLVHVDLRMALGLVALDVGISLAMLLLTEMQHRPDLAARQVEVVEGTCGRVRQESHDGSREYLEVALKRFAVSDQAYQVLERLEGRSCRVYYLPHSQVLVNVEVLDPQPIHRPDREVEAVRARVRAEMEDAARPSG